jgi:TonB family protein
VCRNPGSRRAYDLCHSRRSRRRCISLCGRMKVDLICRIGIGASHIFSTMNAWRVSLIVVTAVALTGANARDLRQSNYDSGRSLLQNPDIRCGRSSDGATGSGLFRLRVDIKTGRVKEITTLGSTGNAVLDIAAIQTLREWRFKPGVLPSIRQIYPRTTEPHADVDCFIRIPISFTLPNMPPYHLWARSGVVRIVGISYDFARDNHL